MTWDEEAERAKSDSSADYVIRRMIEHFGGIENLNRWSEEHADLDISFGPPTATPPDGWDDEPGDGEE
jgi:hypothetical protein